jgi:hypothetical protein
MTIRRRKLTIVGIVVVAVVLVITAGVIAIHHGFSARDRPSAMETLVAATARKLAVPSKAKNLTNPVVYSDAELEDAHIGRTIVPSVTRTMAVGVRKWVAIFIRKRPICALPLRSR